jgi:protein SCO1
MISRRCALQASLSAATVLMAPRSTMAEAIGLKRPRAIPLAPLYQLITHRQKRLQPGDIHSHPLIIAFGYTHCPDVCPTTLLILSNLIQSLGSSAAKLRTIFITVDPDRDTPSVLRDYLTSFDPRIIGLSGDPIDIDIAAHAFKAFYERKPGEKANYSVDHTMNVYLLDRYGLLAGVVELLNAPEPKLRAFVERLLAQ